MLKVSCAQCKYIRKEFLHHYCSKIVDGLQKENKLAVKDNLKMWLGTLTSRAVTSETVIKMSDPTKFLCILFEDTDN